MIICDGQVRTAFLNHFAAVRPARAGNSLVFPVFDYSPQTKNCSFSSCVGVVECFIKESLSLVQLFVALKNAMQIVGLSTLQECQIYDTIPGLTHAADEIQNALQTVCASHGLPFGQVWIPYETKNSHHHVPDNQTTKGIHLLKLIGYCDYHDGDLMSSLKEYYCSCDLFPLRIGEGLVGKALETYEPFFCSNIQELRLHDYWRLMSHNIECSCLAISLRTNDNIVFAFEFLWPTSRNHFILLESILLTLKRCFPSFNFASGAQIGDELHVLDVENSTGSGLGFFKIFDKNTSSQISKALEERRRSLVVDECMSSLKVDCTMTPNPLPLKDVKQQSERFTQEAAQNVNERVRRLKHDSNVVGISEWQRSICVKRKLSDLCESQTDSN
ncbi:NIN-like protein [Artemisia annua]|uniref:NIN-like protein n=1 Tax=Artemisia annua TaxID=35608 RepID=A0A2U1P821_ARTAN|nr:NIN-like protein [Artemisia annua]